MIVHRLCIATPRRVQKSAWFLSFAKSVNASRSGIHMLQVLQKRNLPIFSLHVYVAFYGCLILIAAMKEAEITGPGPTVDADVLLADINAAKDFLRHVEVRSVPIPNFNLCAD